MFLQSSSIAISFPILKPLHPMQKPSNVVLKSFPDSISPIKLWNMIKFEKKKELI